MDVSLNNLDHLFPSDWSAERLARAKTIFFKALALDAHRFYGGKIQTLPCAPMPGFHWLNAWYTPGVSAISTGIRDNPDLSFDVSWRGNAVAVVSDSTRVLGDGNVGPAGGLGVMEGKAFLMKVLGGVDAVPLCIDSRNADGKNDPDILIEWVKRVTPSFGAVNLEDISQPNCFRVLDILREECDIPVWHDDAQGTGCVTLAGLLNALKVADKNLANVKIVFYGAGASNTTIARLILLAGANPENVIMLDSRGGLHTGREDIERDARFYRKWEICRQTNPARINDIEAALIGADVLIALSTPGPDIIRPEWIRKMAPRSIVFACANPVPEIYPYAAKEAGALIVATGRGDFPNQVNNSVGFPGILKGALAVRARKITDQMAIVAAQSIAAYAERQGLTPDYIMPLMTEEGVFSETAAAVAEQAVQEGHAREPLARDEVLKQAQKDIREARAILDMMMNSGFIAPPPPEMIQSALNTAIQTSG